MVSRTSACGVLNADGFASNNEILFQRSPSCLIYLGMVLSFFPTSTIASTAGFNSLPNSVNEYSTVGGEVSITCRRTTPSAASIFSRCVSIFDDTPFKSCFNSEKRRGWALRNQMIFGVHAPPMILRHSPSGQLSGGGITLFLRLGINELAPTVWAVSNW